jgi:acyl dehydratase
MSLDITLPQIDWFPIEAGHIFTFARAIGDPNPIYSDRAYAAASPLGSVIAPPTFLEAGTHFDAAFPYRPRLGEPWRGSAAEPTGTPAAREQAGTDLHAETHFEYRKLLRPGMVLHVAARHGKSWETEGKRAGRLTFGEGIYEYYDEGGELVAVNRTVIVRTERKVEQPALARRESPGPPPALTLPAAYPAPPFAGGVGERREAVVASNLSRAQIIQYAGASGDVSPQHVDEVYNTRVAGYPSVFGHGMLTMAMTGRMLTDWVGDGALTRFGFQFRQQVWPGDSVIASGVVREVTDGVAEIDVETHNQHGDLLGKGYATARLGG